MDISKTAGYPPSGNKSEGGSFADSLRQKGSDSKGPQLAFASYKSSAAGDLAAGLSWMSPNFTPSAGDGMLEAMGMAEGANDAMRRYEEKMNGADPATAP